MSELTTEKPQPPIERSRPRWGRMLAWTGLFAFLGILALGLKNSNRGPVAVGETAPTFSLTTFDGQTFDTNTMQGKVVLVNFWASWCKPCEQEAADLEAAWRYYKDRGDVIFLGVDYVDTEKAALVYLDRFDITYPNGPDLASSISTAFRTTGVPETYIIDKNGKLASFKLSPFLSLEEIKGMIDPLLEP